MPRRDGMPTNEELITDLNVYGRDIFLSAYGRNYGDGIIPRSFISKRLGNLALTIVQYHKPEEDLPGHPLISETLSLRVANLDDADEMESRHLRYRGDKERADKLRVASMFLGQLAVGESITDEHDPYPEAFVTEWVGHMRSTNRKRHVSSLKSRPSKQSLVSAIEMAKDSLEYVKSDEDGDNPIRRFQKGVMDNEGEFYYFRHKWAIQFSYDLEFTGYENIDYLEHTKRALQEEISRFKDQQLLSEGSETDALASSEQKRMLKVRSDCLERVNRAIANNLLMNM